MADETIRERTWLIYKVTCLISGKSYIGLTRHTLHKRWTDHVFQATRKSSPMLLHKAIRKYGRDVFVMAVIEECDTLESASIAERAAIVSAQTMKPNGYNLAEGGMGTPGVRRPHSAETRAKIAAANKSRIMSVETLMKVSAQRTGKNLGDQAKEKLRAFHLANPRGSQFIQRMIAAKIGVPVYIRALRLLRAAIARIDAGECRAYRAEHGRFSTRIAEGATKRHLGTFDTIPEAIAVYREAVMVRLVEVTLRAREWYGRDHKYWKEISGHD